MVDVEKPRFLVGNSNLQMMGFLYKHWSCWLPLPLGPSRSLKEAEAVVELQSRRCATRWLSWWWHWAISCRRQFVETSPRGVPPERKTRWSKRSEGKPSGKAGATPQSKLRAGSKALASKSHASPRHEGEEVNHQKIRFDMVESSWSWNIYS